MIAFSQKESILDIISAKFHNSMHYTYKFKNSTYFHAQPYIWLAKHYNVKNSPYAALF